LICCSTEFRFSAGAARRVKSATVSHFYASVEDAGGPGGDADREEREEGGLGGL